MTGNGPGGHSLGGMSQGDIPPAGVREGDIGAVRWGVLSTARINEKVLAGAREAAGVDVVAVGSRDRARGEEFAARGFHPGGVHISLADGSVRFIRDGIALNTWNALGTRAGGETATPE